MHTNLSQKCLVHSITLGTSCLPAANVLQCKTAISSNILVSLLWKEHRHLQESVLYDHSSCWVCNECIWCDSGARVHSVQLPSMVIYLLGDILNYLFTMPAIWPHSLSDLAGWTSEWLSSRIILRSIATPHNVPTGRVHRPPLPSKIARLFLMTYTKPTFLTH